MAISSQHLATALFRMITQHPDKTTALVEGFLEYIDEKKLQSLLPRIARAIERMHQSAINKETVHIRVATDAAEQEINTIIQYIKPQQDAPTVIHRDEQIIGGFLAQYQNIVYDASIRSNIKRARAALLS